MVVVKGEGRFADAVRRALEYAQSRGVDLSGVEVEVVADPSVQDFGAYTEHHGGLRFRIRYNPRYVNDVVLASHEAGHVAHWAWAVKTGRTLFFSNPNVIEPLAEAFGAVVARELFGVPVTFKGTPHNLTKILPESATYITVTVDGKPIAVKVPEWSDHRSRYRAGVFVAPYFYNVTNWAHVFGNFTAAPADIIETVHKAWQSRAVEFVPGWGPVWRKEPTWSWTDVLTDRTLDDTPVLQKTGDAPSADTLVPTATPQIGNATQKNDAATDSTILPQADAQKAIAHVQPLANVPLPPSNVQPPRYFSSDIAPSPASPEWSNYISGRRVLVVFRNWPSLDTTTLKETRKDYVAGVGAVSGGSLRLEGRVPVPRVVDPNAWIEVVDEKTGKVLTRLRSDELYKLTSEGTPVTLYWSHVAVEEKWPGWERFVERAKELEEKLGTWRTSSAVVVNPGDAASDVKVASAIINQDSKVSAVKVTNAPTEYVPPKVPDDVRKQFEGLLSDLKKLGEKVNLRNVGEVHDRFIQLRDKALDIALAYPQLIDEANEAVGRVGSAIRAASSKLYSALAKAAGRDSFWRGDGDVKTPIGAYRYDPATGAFLLSLYDRPVAENIVGYIKEDGTPVVLKKTRSMSEALEEYNKLLKSPTSGQDSPKQTSAQTSVQQSSGNRQAELPPPLDALIKTPVFGPVLRVSKLSLQTPSSQQADFLQPLYSTLTKVPVAGPVLQTAKLFLQAPPSGGSKAGTGTHSEPMPVVQTQTSAQSTTQPNKQRDFLWPVYRGADFLADALKAGAGIKLAAFGVTALGGDKPFSDSGSGEQQFVATTPKPAPESRVVYNRRRGMPVLGGTSQLDRSDYLVDSGFVQPPSGRQQKAGEPVSVRHVRPPDYVLIETKSKLAASSATPSMPPDYVLIEMQAKSSGTTSPPSVELVQQPSSQKSDRPVSRFAKPPDHVLVEQESQRSGAAQVSPVHRPADYVVSQQSGGSERPAQPPPSMQMAEVSQPQSGSEEKRYRGRPVALPI
jgi:hypothetical protein